MTSADDEHRATLRRLAQIETDRRAERRQQRRYERTDRLRTRWEAIRTRGATLAAPTSTAGVTACGDVGDRC